MPHSPRWSVVEQHQGEEWQFLELPHAEHNRPAMAGRQQLAWSSSFSTQRRTMKQCILPICEQPMKKLFEHINKKHLGNYTSNGQMIDFLFDEVLKFGNDLYTVKLDLIAIYFGVACNIVFQMTQLVDMKAQIKASPPSHTRTLSTRSQNGQFIWHSSWSNVQDRGCSTNQCR